jgi:hypothetical protein
LRGTLRPARVECAHSTRQQCVCSRAPGVAQSSEPTRMRWVGRVRGSARTSCGTCSTPTALPPAPTMMALRGRVLSASASNGAGTRRGLRGEVGADMQRVRYPVPEPTSSARAPGRRCELSASRHMACMCGAEMVTPKPISCGESWYAAFSAKAPRSTASIASTCSGGRGVGGQPARPRGGRAGH